MVIDLCLQGQNLKWKNDKVKEIRILHPHMPIICRTLTTMSRGGKEKKIQETDAKISGSNSSPGHLVNSNHETVLRQFSERVHCCGISHFLAVLHEHHPIDSSPHTQRNISYFADRGTKVQF